VRQAAGAVVESLEGRWLLSAGDLDSSFGTAGRVTTGFTASTVDTATAVAKDASGRIVVAGNQAGTGDIIVARYLSGGALDTSFGNQGKATIDFGGSDFVEAIAIDGSGIYLAGARGLDMALARLTSAGALDPTFDGDGVAVVNLGAGVTDAAGAIAIASDGIYIGGTAFNPNVGFAGQNVFAVAKFTTSGASLGTFGSNTAIGNDAQLTALVAVGSDVIAGGNSISGGITSFALARYGSSQWTQTTDFFGGADSRVAALANRGGTVLAIGTSNGLALAQYNISTGAPDLLFNPANIASPSTYVDPLISGVMSVRTGGLDAAGGLIVAGTELDTSPSRLAAVRYTFGLGGPARDSFYGSGGIASSDVGDPVHAHTLQFAAISSADSSVVLVGDAFGPDQGSNFGGALVNGAGAVTATFNTDFTGPTTDQGTASVVDSAGRIIVAGTKNRVLDDGVVQHVVLIRYTPAGALDTTFGTNGVAEVNFGTRAETFQSLALDSSGNILVAGLDANGGIKVARVIGGSSPTAGTLDGTFATAGILTVDVVMVDSESAVRVASDGTKVVVAGTTATLASGEDFYVMRYNANGSVDGGFNSGNILIFDPRLVLGGSTAPGNDLARAVVVLADGSIVVGGSSDNTDTGFVDFAVARINSSGAVVATAFQALADNGAINALAVQGTKVIAAGQVFATVVAARFDTVSGTFDNTFGTGGVASLDSLATRGGAKGVAVDSHNQIGLVSTLDASNDLIVIRLTATGALDNSFSGDGVANSGLISGDNDAAGIAVDAGGNIVAAGSFNVADFNRDVAVERFRSGYIVNPTVAINGAPASSPEGTPISLTSTVTPGSDAIQSYAWNVTKNGNPYASGNTASFSFTPNDNGSYVVTLTVTAADGGLGSDTKSIGVTNVNPTATINGAPASSPAGTPINLTSTVTDPAGAADPLTYAWSVTRNGVAYGTPGTSANYSFTPADAATYVVTLTVSDGDGGSDTKTKTINVTPAVATVSATLSGGILTLTGNGGANTISVSFNGAGNYQVVIDGIINQAFTFGAVNNIVIQAGTGNDIITVANGVAIATEIHGGDGNDLVSGGSGNDMIFGEAGTNILAGNSGDDVVVGGAGIDIISGGNGRDVLIGGFGTDIITGDNGDDILIAGATAHDTSPAGLAAIRSIWTGGGSYSTRVTTLHGNLLKASNLFNDTSIDLLSGNNGQDWIIANTAGSGTLDLVLGTTGSEIVTDL
jgi:uncharacterized delta-60 repeat protein